MILWSVKEILAFLLISVFVILIVEGGSSTTIAIFEMLRSPPLSSPSRYDRELGWTSIPSTYHPDFFGTGKYVRTNAQGYRNDAETTVQVPIGKLRIICSGDSFTYGQGVANNHVWCHRLSELSKQIETVNLGQPGYGVDQMYLRYLKDGIGLEHSIHIFAFVSGDFNRMGRANQHRHGKPMLELDQDGLRTKNVPVPRFLWWVSRGVERADFRSIDLVQRVLARLSPSKISELDENEIRAITSKVFESVKQLSSKNNITPVFVFLPTEKDIGKESSWRAWVASTMKNLALPFVDLTPAIRALSAPRLTNFFIPEGIPSVGHYTEDGNDWVADELYRKLMEIPRIRTLLDKTEVL